MSEIKTKKRKKEKKPVSVWKIVLTGLIITIVNYCILTVVLFIPQLFILVEDLNDHLNRLNTAVTTAQTRTETLTEDYGKRYIEKLVFLNYVMDHGDESFETLAETYFENETVYLADAEGTVIGQHNGAVEEDEDSILALVNRLEGEGNSYVSLQNTQKEWCYAGRTSTGNYIILITPAARYDEFIDNIYTGEEILMLNQNDEEYFTFSIKNDVIFTAPDESLIGRPAEEVIGGYDHSTRLNANDDIQFRIMYFNDQYVFAFCVYVESMNLELYYAAPISFVFRNNQRIIPYVCLVMALFMFIYAFYTYCLRQDKYCGRGGTKSRYGDGYKRSALVGIALIVTGAFTYYMLTLSSLNGFIQSYKKSLKDVKKYYEDRILCEKDLKTDYDNAAREKAEMISTYLSDHPDRRMETVLADLSNIFQADYIMMFDLEGNETITDSPYTGCTISTNPDDQTYVFNPLKKGVPYAERDTAVDQMTGETNRVIGVTTMDETSHVDGFLLMTYTPSDLVNALDSASISTIFDQSILSNTYDFLLVDPEENVLLYTPEGRMSGISTSEYGLEEADISPSFTGYLNTEDGTFFAFSSQLEQWYVYICLQTDTLFFGRMALVIAVVVLLMINLIYMRFMTNRMPVTEPVEETAKDRPASKLGEWIAQLKQRLLGADWNSRTAEEKLGVLLSHILFTAAFIIAVFMIFRGQLFQSNSLMSFIINQTWPKGFNSFSVAAVALMTILIYVVTALIKRLLQLIPRFMSPTAETVCRLLSSCIEYVSVITALYIALGCFGMDVQALARSVGFVALIVGFGTKSLIQDIVAGIFIIFEREFQVGDIVEISGYRGMVKEIGLRTTKLVSWDKNVKIINNHNISSVLNLTMRNSFATVNFSVPVTTSVTELEDIFSDELGKLSEKYPAMIGKPYFVGILSFSGSRMECRVAVEVKELDRGALETALHREIQEILERHNIPMK